MSRQRSAYPFSPYAPHSPDLVWRLTNAAQDHARAPFDEDDVTRAVLFDLEDRLIMDAHAGQEATA